MTFTFKYVDNQEEFAKAVEDLSNCCSYAFDSEGVDLGRTPGSLTVATISSLEENSTIYVIDVQVLGGDTVFSNTEPSLKQILEDTSSPIVTFDCRADSDALFHHFDVELSNVCELQVLDQAVRILDGNAPPKRCDYLKQADVPGLPSMSTVAARFGVGSLCHKQNAPHLTSKNVWGQRPLGPNAIEYAATDVDIIRKIHRSAWDRIRSRHRKWNDLWSKLECAYKVHSERYVTMFRDRKESFRRYSDRTIIIEEHPIMDEADLPSTHPKVRPESKLKGRQVWDSAVQMLESKTQSTAANQAFNHVLFILQHDEWYTKEAFEYIRKLAAGYPYFTGKQRQRIRDPPELRKEEDYDDYDYYYDSDENDYFSGWR